jgi:hypothetical protein
VLSCDILLDSGARVSESIRSDRLEGGCAAGGGFAVKDPLHRESHIDRDGAPGLVRAVVLNAIEGITKCAMFCSRPWLSFAFGYLPPT